MRFPVVIRLLDKNISCFEPIRHGLKITNSVYIKTVGTREILELQLVKYYSDIWLDGYFLNFKISRTTHLKF